ncbi:MAG: 30S ribosomal protein S20 [Desulfobacterales bacterium]|nr:30S ribosomal protein S20 [Desulfobacterales bacterium]MDD4072287.1 30S ribosomal protein S20 [Desulfobacterales bacterium]MDD4392698.1 30S ribosomal protein S20 [Desulfobacterales bacterium]
MANHKSAIKRALQNETRRLRNKGVKSRIKNVVKQVRLDAAENNADSAVKDLIAAQGAIDKASKRGVIHSKTAARKISRLSKLVNGINA